MNRPILEHANTKWRRELHDKGRHVYLRGRRHENRWKMSWAVIVRGWRKAQSCWFLGLGPSVKSIGGGRLCVALSVGVPGRWWTRGQRAGAVVVGPEVRAPLMHTDIYSYYSSFFYFSCIFLFLLLIQPPVSLYVSYSSYFSLFLLFLYFPNSLYSSLFFD